VATYRGTTLEFTELLRATHSFTNVYTPVAMEVIGTPEFNDLEGCPNTFGNIVYIYIYIYVYIYIYIYIYVYIG